MSTIKIFPINVAIYYDTPKRYLKGLVYSEAELEEIRQFCKEKNLYYALAYRTTDPLLTHAPNNL
jgi:hypothetical protein